MMLTHSSLDDIEYSHSTRRSIKNRHRHRGRSSNKFINYIDDKCAVCLDDATTLDTKLFPCGHTFHGQCLIQWVTVQKGRKFNCPLCRQDIAHFIQMTGNQHINKQLIQIWNEQYLYNTSDSSSIPQQQKNNKIQCIETDEPLKIVSDQTDIIKPTETIKIKPVLSINDIVKRVMDKTDIISKEIVNNNNNDNNKKSDGAIWKFLWNSPLSVLYQQRNDGYPSFKMFKSLLCSMYHTDIIYDNDNVHDTDINKENSNLYSFLLPYIKQTMEIQINSTDCTDSQEEQQCVRNTKELRLSLLETDGRYNDLFPFSLINFECGIFAGFGAGATTYLISQQMKRELIGKGSHILNGGSLRSTLCPILSETIPSVAIFFMSYEHIKKYVFNTDSINNSYHQLFTARFISAGIASCFAYFAPNIIGGRLPNIGGTGLLPLRFASFFGTFELCKDLINKNHEEISMFKVASSAAIGGGISHSLYYPLLQYKNQYIMNIESVPILSRSGTVSYHGSRDVMIRYLYKGWLSSLREFLPSCIVCSCAFEISKRYLNP